MRQEQIEALISRGAFPEGSGNRKLVETHISWVILGERYVYKIKKPMKYSFLDFSTPDLRKHFCEEELVLNRRMSENLYLDVLPVRESNGSFAIGGERGKVVDYALKMRKLDPQRQMDILISEDKVSRKDIKNLARCIADLHKNSKIIRNKDVLDIREKFNDLASEAPFLHSHLGETSRGLIEGAMEISNTFLREYRELMQQRLEAGFYRDGHGDLHTRNIFLLPEPQPFDCLEFNSDYRRMDVLNEVAFLCMDLDSLERKDLSDLFIEEYNLLFPSMRNSDEEKLFRYYKSYRANIRAKVNSLRARSAADSPSLDASLSEAGRYLDLMMSYLESLDNGKITL